MQGYGIFTCIDGSIYEGIFKKDKKHGYGVLKYIDGSIYAGNWE